MTMQIAHLIEYRGELLEVVAWACSREKVPSNQDLGIETEGWRSDNWTGRLDEYVVRAEGLVLRYVLASLPARASMPRGGVVVAPGEIPQRWRNLMSKHVSSHRAVLLEFNAPIALDGIIVCRRVGGGPRVEVLRFAEGRLADASSSDLPPERGIASLTAPRTAAAVVLRSVGPDRKLVWRILSDVFRTTVSPEQRRAWLDAPPAVLLTDEPTILAETLVFALRSAGAVVDIAFNDRVSR